MAITTALSVGYPQTITQNAVYAAPARAVRIRSSAALEGSQDGSTFAALTGAETVGGVDSAVAFIRCTTTNAIVTCKAY